MFARRALRQVEGKMLGFQRRRIGTLVVADHENGKLHDSSLSAVTAALKLGQPVTVLVAGSGCRDVAEKAATIANVTKVVLADDKAYAHGVAEPLAALVKDVQQTSKYSFVVASSNQRNKNWLPRFAVGIDTQPITEVQEIKSADTFVRPIYAGNAIMTVKSSDAVKALLVRPTSFDKAPTGATTKAPIEAFASASAAGASAGVQWVGQSVSKGERPELTSAKVVVSGGKGLKSAENFKILNELADAIGGAAVGASRAAVDAGFAPNDLQIGQTGKIVAPDLYVAVGISGAIQHLAGMKDSKTIVAINKDPEAPIFQVADFGLVEDLFTAVPALTKAVKEGK